MDNCAAETDPIATAARGVVKGRKTRKTKSKHKPDSGGSGSEDGTLKSILIVPPRPPPPTQPFRPDQLEEVGRKGIIVQRPPPPSTSAISGRTKGRDIEEQSDRGASLDSRVAASLGGGDGNEQGDVPPKQLLASGMRMNLLLGFGIILGLIGATLLVALGILYVKPYSKVRNMKLTMCTVSATVLTDELVTCACASDSSQSCLSRYPCLKLWVNYTTGSGGGSGGEAVINATLYNSYDTFVLQHTVHKVRKAQWYEYNNNNSNSNVQ